jgi:hypothetical protein
MSVGQTIKGYIWWTYPRGSLHYDVMVTLILAFIFLAPRWINFADKPPGRPAHPTAVLVRQDGNYGLIYQIDAAAIDATDDREIRLEMKRVIDPISGGMVIDHYEKQADAGSQVYRIWAHR